MSGQVLLSVDKEYLSFLSEVKEQIQRTRIRAALAASGEMLQLYWQIGHEIIERQKTTRWGSKLIEQLANDLQNAFPGAEGYSVRNIKYMRTFAQNFPQFAIGQRPVAQLVYQLPWGQIIILMQKAKESRAREWYIAKTLENGWSRDLLAIQIDSKLYERQGRAEGKTHNFVARLPHPQSDLAENTLKNPYLFNFISADDTAHEKEIENDLVKHITQFLLELGKGFAYMGRQYPLTVGDDTFYIDLLFYHVDLHCYVVIELKAGKFMPEYAGKLNFYLSAVDDLLKKPQDNPSIGILMCRSKNKTQAEYALKDINKPMGVSEYQLLESLPKKLGKSLPSIKELEAELMTTKKKISHPKLKFRSKAKSRKDKK